jgi:predicted DNA-binding WGR domain protein
MLLIELIGDIINFFLHAFGIEFSVNFKLNIDFQRFFYIASGPTILILLYVVAWKRIGYYSTLMDRYIMELWTKEESETHDTDASKVVTKLRLEKLKRQYIEKIEKARHKRDLIFKRVPFIKWYYKRKKGKDIPMYTLPQ